LSTTPQASGAYTEEEISVEQIKKETLNRRIQAARSLAERMQVAPDGSRVFVRFSASQRLEHLILMVSFGTLAVTGLLQTLSFLPPIALVVQLLGGVDAIRTIHRLAALVSAIQSVYHLWRILVPATLRTWCR
jgi:thiosulfate reductase cytochrome b subunit